MKMNTRKNGQEQEAEKGGKKETSHVLDCRLEKLRNIAHPEFFGNAQTVD
jgi:hypothetical protein